MDADTLSEKHSPLHDVQYYSHCLGFEEYSKHRRELNPLTSSTVLPALPIQNKQPTDATLADAEFI